MKKYSVPLSEKDKKDIRDKLLFLLTAIEDYEVYRCTFDNYQSDETSTTLHIDENGVREVTDVNLERNTYELTICLEGNIHGRKTIEGDMY